MKNKKAVPKIWPTILIKGLFIALLGVFAIFNPEIALNSLIVLIGIFTLVSGLFTLFFGIKTDWLSVTFEGVLTAVVGIAVMAWPNITTDVIIYLIAIWALIKGAFEIYSAAALRKVIKDEIWKYISGAISLIFGILFLFIPKTGETLFGILIGIYAIVFGLSTMMLGLKIHDFREHFLKDE